MKIYMKLLALVFLFISLLIVPMSIACTIFTASSGKTVMFGGNEDQAFYSKSSFLVVDVSGALDVIYFATPWKKWPLVMQMGINEMGLCYDTNWIPKEKLNPHPERKPQQEWAITQIMKQASTVEEVISKIFTYNWGDSTEAQFHFADKFGDAVVIHPGADGELTYTRKPKGNGYLVSTNFNLSKLAEDPKLSLKKRYKTADEMLSKIVTENDLTVESVASVLDATHQNQLLGAKTLYSAVYDLQKLRIYLYYNRQFDEPYVLDVKEELAKTVSFRKIALKDLISNRNLGSGKYYSWPPENEGVAENGVFKRTTSPAFTFEYPIGCKKIMTTSPGQIIKMRHPEGFRIYASILDIPEGIKLQDYGPKFYAQKLENHGSNIKVLSNKEITLKCSTKAYRTDINWLLGGKWPQTSIILSVYRDGKCIFLNTLTWKNSDKLEPIIQSLTFK